MKYLYIVSIFCFLGCVSKSHRLPASINSPEEAEKPIQCGVKCAVGPVTNKFFQIKAIKVKYIEADQFAPDGVVTQPAVKALYDYCKKYSTSLSSKKGKEYAHIAVSSNAPLYHGQLLKADSSGHIEIPNQSGFGLNVYTACPRKIVRDY